MGKYDWKRVIEIVKEVLPQCDEFTELACAVDARIGMRRTTLRDGLKRELGLSTASITELREALLPEDKRLSPLAQALLSRLRRRRDVALSLLDLIEELDRSPSSIRTAAGELYKAGYGIDLSDDMHLMMPKEAVPTKGVLLVDHWAEGPAFRFGVVADPHVANRCSRKDVQEAAFDLFVAEGVTKVIVPGNLLDGEFKYNRHELVAHGVEGQIVHCAKEWPQRESIETWFLSANCHEGWWGRTIGLDIGRHMESGFHDLGRTDMHWLGHVQRDLGLHPDNPRSILRIVHPGGGSAYALSYPIQKIVESWQGGEKPTAAVFGHFHKYDVNYIREVFCAQVGTACDQTFFMALHKLAAHVGFIIVEIRLTPYGAIQRAIHEWMPFYDRGFYQQEWDYRSIYTEIGKDRNPVWPEAPGK